ncbi:hypothetical protein, partial [Paraburkholderia atlantica]|uniref:hypothetical protein n=1 Tax=Paraburkholderia atlantica TaxID=2654982 RepID=UPI001C37A56E
MSLPLWKPETNLYAGRRIIAADIATGELHVASRYRYVILVVIRGMRRVVICPKEYAGPAMRHNTQKYIST